MRLQRSPNRWSCTATAFAMVLDVGVETIVALVGHDGGNILWPDHPEPLCRQGFHIQELIDVADAFGYAVTPFEARLFSGGPNKEPKLISLKESPNQRLQRVMKNRRGVVNGITRRGIGHSIAWDGLQAFDTNGTLLDMAQFTPHVFWEVTRKTPTPEG